MYVWLDDVRPMPKRFDVWVKTAAEAIELIDAGGVELISLDNDLGLPMPGVPYPGEGYDVAVHIEKGAFEGTVAPMQVTFHTANVVRASHMASAVWRAETYWHTFWKDGVFNQEKGKTE